jgi:protein-S-isoprenylcysteine O-methyltransferase Ste14
MRHSETASRAFILSLIAGILILINTTLLGVAATWFPGIIPTLPGSSGNDITSIYSLTAIGLIFGALVAIGAVLLNRNPEQTKAWGILIIVFSLASITTGGGFVIGFILGIIGGASALRWKPKIQVTEPNKRSLPSDRATEMGAVGVGRKIMAPMFVTLIITALISYAFRPMFNYPVPVQWTLALGVLFLVIGVPFWLLAVRTFLKARSRGQLATRGPFAVMPDPIYGSFIVFVMPGISLVLNWWPILLTSVIMFVALRMFIHEEDDALREKFGRQYEEYRKKVLIKFL